MYSIDINLLKDRPVYGQSAAPGVRADTGDRTPMILGIAVGGGLLGLVLLTFAILTLLNQRLIAREAELTDQLTAIAPELSRVESLKAQEKQTREETKALATIFNQIKPWAAMLQDIRDRTPPTLQITRIEQVAPPPPSPAPTPSPSPGATPAPPPPPPNISTLNLYGNSLSFGDINDFVLTLQKSPFLKGDATRLITSQRQAENPQIPVSLVGYQLTTEINDVPATELLEVLNRKGATGLVTRINILKQRGVVKP